MTMPPLPPLGSEDWFAWAQWVHAAVAAATSAATPDTLVRRDAAGRAQVADGSAAGDIATKGQLDAAVAGLASPSLANLPAGTTITVLKSGGVWPARPTARADVFVQWKGADPSPAIVSSGTGGMLDGIDSRFVTP